MMKLRIFRATVVEIPWYPKKDEAGGNQVMLVTAPLDQKLAEALRCKEMCFDAKGVPRSFENKIGLTIRVRNTAIEIGEKVYKSPLVHKFKVGRKRGAADNDVTLHLEMRMHFAGDDFDLIGWSRSNNTGEFSLTILPNSQDDFDFAAMEETENDDQEPIEKHLTGPALASHREMQSTRKPRAGAN